MASEDVAVCFSQEERLLDKARSPLRGDATLEAWRCGSGAEAPPGQGVCVRESGRDAPSRPALCGEWPRLERRVAFGESRGPRGGYYSEEACGRGFGFS